MALCVAWKARAEMYLQSLLLRRVRANEKDSDTLNRFLRYKDARRVAYMRVPWPFLKGNKAVSMTAGFHGQLQPQMVRKVQAQVLMDMLALVITAPSGRGAASRVPSLRGARSDVLQRRGIQHGSER